MNQLVLSPCCILGMELAFIYIVSFNYPGAADIIFPILHMSKQHSTKNKAEYLT